MPMNNIGDRISRDADADVGFDDRGYLLKPGNDGDSTVRKTEAATDEFLGVNYRSTLDLTDDNVDLGRPVAVQLDASGPVLCDEGFNYTEGDAVYVSGANNGHATADADPAGDGSVTPTKVGIVVDSRDLSGATEPDLVQVSYIGSGARGEQ